jgi:hypothetical protein
MHPVAPATKIGFELSIDQFLFSITSINSPYLRACRNREPIHLPAIPRAMIAHQ